MADLKSYPIEECVLARSKLLLFADLSTGKITFSSPEADELFQTERTEEVIVPMEPLAIQENEDSVAVKEDVLADMPALRQKPIFREKSSAAPSLIGQNLSSLFASVDQFEETGVIQPTEILSLADKDFSKWIYSCTYITEGKIATIYLLDASELKKEYTNISRNPIPVDSVKKMVSPAIPDYILEAEYIVGDISSLRVDESGIVTELFPFSEKFMGISRARLFNHPIMEFVHQSDQVVLAQALSECSVSGVCHFIIRWNPLSTDKTRDGSKTDWIQVKASKSNEKSSILTISSLLPNSIEEKPSATPKAWSFLGSTQNYTYGLSSNTAAYSFGGLFGGTTAKSSVPESATKILNSKELK